jgi:hypothetical protein
MYGQSIMHHACMHYLSIIISVIQPLAQKLICDLTAYVLNAILWTIIYDLAAQE